MTPTPIGWNGNENCDGPIRCFGGTQRGKHTTDECVSLFYGFGDSFMFLAKLHMFPFYELQFGTFDMENRQFDDST